ncbi:NAD-binding protein, partial [Klebsiella pneumoniae]|nr:NAD-binding protein [Klebsiella pneumoniae]
MTQNLHHIVIVGGGAGGLELATQLGETFGKNRKAKITLVDQNLTHI